MLIFSKCLGYVINHHHDPGLERFHHPEVFPPADYSDLGLTAASGSQAVFEREILLFDPFQASHINSLLFVLLDFLRMYTKTDTLIKKKKKRGAMLSLYNLLFALGDLSGLIECLLCARHSQIWLILFSQLQSGPLYGSSVIYLTRTLGSFPVFFKQSFSEHPCTYVFVFLCK